MSTAPSPIRSRSIRIFGPGPPQGSARELLIAAALTLAFAVSATPLVVVEQPSWDFGTVTNCAELTHDFSIRNAGDANLAITQVRSSCAACLSAAADKLILPPGATTLVHCHLDLHALSGRVARAVVLTCNDPGNPSPVLSLAGFSVPAYAISPLEVTLDCPRDGPLARPRL